MVSGRSVRRSSSRMMILALLGVRELDVVLIVSLMIQPSGRSLSCTHVSPGVEDGCATAGGREDSTSTPATSPAARSRRLLLHSERNGVVSNAGLAAHGRTYVGSVVNDRTADAGRRGGRLRGGGGGVVHFKLLKTIGEVASVRRGSGVRHGCVCWDNLWE